MTDEWLTTKQAAEMANVTVGSVAKLCKAGSIPAEMRKLYECRAPVWIIRRDVWENYQAEKKRKAQKWSSYDLTPPELTIEQTAVRSSEPFNPKLANERHKLMVLDAIDRIETERYR